MKKHVFARPRVNMNIQLDNDTDMEHLGFETIQKLIKTFLR